MPHLLHFSEDRDIKVFRPHVPASSPDNPPMVWAVDEEHAPGFWFPRQAPRACCWSIGRPMTGIGRSLLGMGAGTRMHAVESIWLERMRACEVFVYRFDPVPFAFYNANAGYYSTTQTIEPLSVEPIGDLLALHAQANIELRIVSPLCNYLGPDPACALPLVLDAPQPIRDFALQSNSFAFGGLNSVLVVARA